MEKTRNFAELLRLIKRDYHGDTALAERGPQGWIYLSHQQLLSEVQSLALYLHSIGIKKGEMVGIMGIAGVRWIVADLAIMAIGAVTVPLFSNISSENFLFECEQTNLKTIFILGAEAWQMYAQHQDLFERVIALDAPPPEVDAVAFEKAIEIGLEHRNKKPKLFDELLDQINEDDLATIIYTSSSTGIPKGVMLSHKNMLFSGFNNVGGVLPEDRYLSVLPLAHVYQRNISYYLLRWNVPIYFFNDPKNVNVALQEVKPTITAFVPRVLEKIYIKIISDLEKEGVLKRTIGQWAFDMALDPDFEHRAFHHLADKIVYQKVRDAFGGHIRFILSGGAPLNPTLNRFFDNIGLPIAEGYGMTEMMFISANIPEHQKIGTVGPAWPEVEIKISPEGEIVVRSDGVMQGYYKNPEATKKALEKGWLHTGDKGEIDSEGCLIHHGRVNDVVKSSVGEWIALTPLENELTSVPFIDLAMVVAEHQKFVSALIFPNFEVIHALKVSQNLGHLTDEQYLNGEYIKREMDKLIDSINAHHNHWEQIHAYSFVLTPPTIEGGELTPTMKLRRNNIMKKYKDQIEGMYPEDLSKKVDG